MRKPFSIEQNAFGRPELGLDLPDGQTITVSCGPDEPLYVTRGRAKSELRQACPRGPEECPAEIHAARGGTQGFWVQASCDNCVFDQMPAQTNGDASSA